MPLPPRQEAPAAHQGVHRRDQPPGERGRPCAAAARSPASSDERGDWFEFMRWKEILEKIEEATDKCEDVADVLEAVAVKNA